MQPKAAILMLSHVTNRQVKNHFRQLKNECSQNYDVVSLCDNTSGIFNNEKNDHDYFLFSLKNLSDLGYEGKIPRYTEDMRQDNPHHKNFNFRPGSTDLPILYYYRNNPNYDYYWVIEYDVRYSGRWDEFFEIFKENDSDLLGTTLTRYPEIPDWYHWGSLDFPGEQIPERERLRGFFPVYRLSNRALAAMDRRYRSGVAGHYECIVPTVINREGLTIEDIGGDGEFVQPENINRFYRNTRTNDNLEPGTFVFRPSMRRPGSEPNLLWHPVKRAPLWRTLLGKLR